MGNTMARRDMVTKLVAATWVIGGALTGLVPRASAQFGPPTFYPTPGSWTPTIGDLNEDGNPDIVVTHYPNQDISILLGNGDGTFAAPTTLSTEFNAATDMEILDVNQDGNMDLVMPMENLGSIYWFPGNGDGTFEGFNSIPVEIAGFTLSPFAMEFDPASGYLTVSERLGGGYLHYTLASGLDVQFGEGSTGGYEAVGLATWSDGLGWALTVANTSSTSNSVRVSKASYLFTDDYPVGTGPRFLAAADLNSDGTPDLAVANALSDSLSILLNTGSSNFAPAVNYWAGGLQYNVATGDVNGDAKIDLVVTISSGGIGVLMGAGDGTFAPPIFHTVAPINDHMAISDLDGDGMNDLVVGTISGLAVLLNQLKPNCRFASSVMGYSSEGSAVASSAQQALGPPNVYPAYGHSAEAWSGATPDGQPEFIELGFPDPAPINFVNVYETHAPGAITSIQVKNPGTGLFEVVWSRPVAVAPPASRLFTATFPATMFPVSEIRIELFSPLVPGYNDVDAVSIGYQDRATTSQWASGLVGFSSEYGAQYAATSALGPPDVYPAYGDLGGAWASLTPDNQFEYLELSYSTPQPINYVSVYETYAPGALDKVWVMNPNTGLYETVWSSSASPAPALSRINTVSFPETDFLVSQVRLDFNSPAVPDWNEVDAVGIGRCACQASVAGVPAPETPAYPGMIEMARPNPFREFTNVDFTLAREGHTRVEVIDLQGRRVAQLLDRSLPGGRHSVRWDGRNASGGAVPSGIYYMRVESAGEQAARKIVKVN
jgi:hypothetical protein